MATDIDRIAASASSECKIVPRASFDHAYSYPPSHYLSKDPGHVCHPTKHASIPVGRSILALYECECNRLYVHDPATQTAFIHIGWSHRKCDTCDWYEKQRGVHAERVAKYERLKGAYADTRGGRAASARLQAPSERESTSDGEGFGMDTFD